MKDYNVRDIVQNLHGVAIDASVGGFDENDFVSIRPMEGKFGDKKGCDGTYTRYGTNASAYEISVHVMNGSDLSTVLQGLLDADLAQANGAGAGPYLIKDTYGIMQIVAQRAWITGDPEEFKLGGEPAGHVWKIKAVNAKAKFGGRA